MIFLAASSHCTAARRSLTGRCATGSERVDKYRSCAVEHQRLAHVAAPEPAFPPTPSWLSPSAPRNSLPCLRASLEWPAHPPSRASRRRLSGQAAALSFSKLHRFRSMQVREHEVDRERQSPHRELTPKALRQYLHSVCHGRGTAIPPVLFPRRIGTPFPGERICHDNPSRYTCGLAA